MRDPHHGLGLPLSAADTRLRGRACLARPGAARRKLTLAQDLPAIWHAETTTDRERKQLLRVAITRVDLDGLTQPGQVAIQIHWRSGTITTLQVARPRPADGSLKTPAEALALIRDLAPHTPTPRSLGS